MPSSLQNEDQFKKSWTLPMESFFGSGSVPSFLWCVLIWWRTPLRFFNFALQIKHELPSINFPYLAQNCSWRKWFALFEPTNDSWQYWQAKTWLSRRFLGESPLAFSEILLFLSLGVSWTLFSVGVSSILRFPDFLDAFLIFAILFVYNFSAHGNFDSWLFSILLLRETQFSANSQQRW